ncbi:MAG: EAL domain-containing protein, partial [Gammaproteobacteria bacterium]|nr:EAL domain-containing protein [Gammaproteobacteria bacterium]
PVNEIKIDRMFIRDLGKSENADKIVTALINLISSLDKSCCAEGVETPMALKKLISLGCDSVQGHLLSEPLPAATFADYCQATAGCSFNEWLFMNKSARSPAVENKRVLHH